MLADVDRARDAVAEVRDLRGGTLGFGMFGTASAYLIADLAADFRRKYPDVRLRLVGLNSSEVADQVRERDARGRARRAPGRRRRARPPRRAARGARRRQPGSRPREQPVTIEALASAPLILYDAQYGADDPMRRSSSSGRSGQDMTLRPVIEVEGIEAAVGLARRGLGDTIVRARRSAGRAPAASTSPRSPSRSTTRSPSSPARKRRSPPPPAPSSRSSNGGSSAWPKPPCTRRARPKRI